MIVKISERRHGHKTFEMKGRFYERSIEKDIQPQHSARQVSERILTSHCSATRRLLATDHLILNQGQVTWTTSELVPPSPKYHTTPMRGH
ncbi:hypothetical protein TNCV_127521 [Trichonephila clavipes]|nr:hypothetical protein TNCV_127521 [Trichonephila clavipes]